ncbi:hypothetical protein MMC20_004993 [Loxospora ochrophaea]|nr:hypothetical protein [Loxospora ochrophaea]
MKSLKTYFHPPEKKDGTTTPKSAAGRVGSTTVPATPAYTGSGAATPVFSGSRPASRPASLYPTGDFRNSTMDDINEIKADVMANWLHQQQMELMWTSGGISEGVVLKKGRDAYSACPTELSSNRGDFYDAVAKLNVKVCLTVHVAMVVRTTDEMQVAMTVNTRVIKLVLRRDDLPYVPLPDGLRLQILPSIAHLPMCQKHHFAAFIKDLSLLIVWDDEPRHLLERAQEIEVQLMKMIWRDDAEMSEKSEKPFGVSVTELPYDGSESGVGREEQIVQPRRVVLIQATLCALTICLLFAAIGSGWRQIAMEIDVDENFVRLAFAVAVPFQMWLALFFMQSVVGCLAQVLGPISQINQNSKFYSGIAPPRIQRQTLPHVTIQCPVYKEGLFSVIEPTVKSLKAAISTYEMQGGTANIFVNDDGMQLISEEDAQARRDFYDEHNIGWVARPKHNPKPLDGEKAFVRAGKFKKASNMNYALAVSARVEDKLTGIQRPSTWSQEDERDSYYSCLQQVIAEDEGRTWAEGNVRVGDYILLIDSDTRVPTDCFLDAVSEMEQSPQVAIIQFTSGVMNVTNSFFEKGITYFTNLIYTAITFAVSCGDVAPFVGHNAILRWSAVQDIAYDDDGTEKYWSESTVSEDFDMALRLQSSGYILRLASYCGDGFKEGVSLTVYDELARWEKYAYGCNELIFHPLRQWIFKGPFTPLFKRFIGSGMPIASKFTIMAYIGTYYAIGSAWILTLLNYFIIGWFNGHLDHYYIDSFKIFFAIIIVFTALGNIALAVLRYRIEAKTLPAALVENFKWIPLLVIFLGGVSLHVSQALLSHMFSIDMSWGATSKEADNTTFFEEIPKLLKKFKFMFLFCLVTIAGIVCLATIAPPFWKINFFTAIFPLAMSVFTHMMLPIALNPNLMLFTW